jgi:hypothetical protein
MHAQQMAATHPGARGRANDALTRCIESCFGCAQACTSRADACLGERSVAELRQCIRLDLDCADVCIATGAVATRRTANQDALLVQMLETCAGFCRLCAEECEKHAGITNIVASVPRPAGPARASAIRRRPASPVPSTGRLSTDILMKHSRTSRG